MGGLQILLCGFCPYLRGYHQPPWRIFLARKELGIWGVPPTHIYGFSAKIFLKKGLKIVFLAKKNNWFCSSLPWKNHAGTSLKKPVLYSTTSPFQSECQPSFINAQFLTILTLGFYSLFFDEEEIDEDLQKTLKGSHPLKKSLLWKSFIKQCPPPFVKSIFFLLQFFRSI